MYKLLQHHRNICRSCLTYIAIANLYLRMYQTMLKPSRNCNTQNKNLQLKIFVWGVTRLVWFCYHVNSAIAHNLKSYRIRKRDSHYFSHSTSCHNMIATCFALFLSGIVIANLHLRMSQARPKPGRVRNSPNKNFQLSGTSARHPKNFCSQQTKERHWNFYQWILCFYYNTFQNIIAWHQHFIRVTGS